LWSKAPIIRADGEADDPTGLVIIPAFVSSARLGCFGVSQIWGFLRHFLKLGMNDEGRGRRVFDGVIITSPAPTSSTEYCQKGTSLIRTDPAGRSDGGLPPNVRVYLIAGTRLAAAPGRSEPGALRQPRNPRSAAPAFRALFLALEQWSR